MACRHNPLSIFPHVNLMDRIEQETQEQNSRDIQHELDHHRQSCIGCPDAMQHVLNLRNLEKRNRGLDLFTPIGAGALQ